MALFSCLLMIRKRTPTFGKDLRYLSRRPRTGRSRVLATLPTGWLPLSIAIAIGIWLGSSPDAAVERSSSTLKNQIQLVLGQDPVTAPETRITTGVSLLPPIEGFQGVAAIEKPTPAIGAVVGETKKENAEDRERRKRSDRSEPQPFYPLR